jgi:hypothetical protein
VRVNSWAFVNESILLPDVKIGRNAKVRLLTGAWSSLQEQKSVSIKLPMKLADFL